MYSPAFPLIFHQYAELLTNEDRSGRPASSTEQKARQREHEPTEVAAKITFEVEPKRRHTLLESAHDVGGISVFIYLFAKVGVWSVLFLGKRQENTCSFSVNRGEYLTT